MTDQTTAEILYESELIALRAELAAIKAQASDATEYVLAVENRELRAENEKLKAERDEARATKDMHKERAEEAWEEVHRLQHQETERNHNLRAELAQANEEIERLRLRPSCSTRFAALPKRGKR